MKIYKALTGPAGDQCFVKNKMRVPTMLVKQMSGTNSPVKMAAWSRMVQRDGHVRKQRKRERECKVTEALPWLSRKLTQLGRIEKTEQTVTWLSRKLFFFSSGFCISAKLEAAEIEPDKPNHVEVCCSRCVFCVADPEAWLPCKWPWWFDWHDTPSLQL